MDDKPGERKQYEHKVKKSGYVGEQKESYVLGCVCIFSEQL